MKKPVKYDLKILIKNNQPILNVQVYDRARQKTALWTSEEFEGRLLRMRERYNDFQNDPGNYKEVHASQDPFFDLNVFMIGTTKFSLKYLSLNTPKDLIAPILDEKDVVQGELHVSIDPVHPTDLEATPSPPVANSDELLHKPLHFIIRIKCIKDLRAKLSKNTYVRYKFYTEDFVSTTFITSRNPVYNFNRKYSIKTLTDDLIAYLEDSELVFEVYGEIADSYDKPATPASPTSHMGSSLPSSPSSSTLTRHSRTFTPTSPTAASSSSLDEDSVKENMALLKENQELKRRLGEANLTSLHKMVEAVADPLSKSEQDNKDVNLHHFNKLDVYVHEAEKLPKKDLFSKCEPYCKVTIGDFKKKTLVQKNTNNPVWNSKLSFKLLGTLDESDHVQFKILDYDRVKKSESIAEVKVSYAEMLNLFRNDTAGWFTLTGKKVKDKGARIRLGFNFSV
ncbi:hypothetical protein AKO1_013614 [Acrasis kona]|uniref:C2 domain-containing protein n=1 Tax=Acrasis kona TaxID=1008807 RepID=A0AAW2YVA3_9EUKA